MSLEQILAKHKIVPVVVIDDAADAVPLARALVSGGLPIAEVTFRTPAAKASIQAMKAAFPTMLVGAGTILAETMADEALDAGADFLVMPATDETLIRHALDRHAPVCPGVMTPSDVQTCDRLGLRLVKFFPAEPAGGLARIQAMSAPYPFMRFMPTGGISLKNMNAYLRSGSVVCVGGSWMVKKEWIAAGQFEKIEEKTREAVRALEEEV